VETPAFRPGRKRGTVLHLLSFLEHTRGGDLLGRRSATKQESPPLREESSQDSSRPTRLSLSRRGVPYRSHPFGGTVQRGDSGLQAGRADPAEVTARMRTCGLSPAGFYGGTGARRSCMST
jgi:hypothetical protein